jgi:CHAT domain-containing protein
LREAVADSAGVIDAVDRELHAILARAERGAHRYLWLDHNAIVRDLYEDVAAGDARLRLGVDLYWRALHSASPPRVDGRGSLLDLWHGYAEAAVRLAAAENAEILVYAIRNDGVHRYRVREQGVDAFRIEMPVADLRALVSRAWPGLSSEPRAADAPVDAALAATLSRLARALLPQDLRAGGVLVVADGFLARLPFEALNLSRDGYQPLLAHSDVVYIHNIGFDRAREPGDHSVVLADPDVPREVQRRIDGYARLPGARIEADHAAAHLPGARVAIDDRATVEWLRQHWEGARYIHIATHAVDDPNVPYYSLLALASVNGSSAMADAFLDVGDVLDADLGACEVAILSGCATGAPRAGGGSVTPSFGDAFIDAGARAVVQTFWNVRDDIAAETMRTFMNHWREGGLPPSTALQRTRRDVALARPHPHYWAAYSIEIAGDPRSPSR